MASRTAAAVVVAAFALAGCTSDPNLPASMLAPEQKPAVAAGSTELDRLISRYAAHYEVPETLVRRVVKRESNFRPEARNGPYWGLMQILPQTARTMGHRGPPSELLDAETNLKYAVKYLRGAYLVADGNQDRAVRFYASGYYYDAKRKGLLVATGLRPDPKDRKRDAELAEAPSAPIVPAGSMSFAGSTPTGGGMATAPVPSLKPAD